MVAFSILAASNLVYRWYHPNGDLTPAEIASRLMHFFRNGYLAK